MNILLVAFSHDLRKVEERRFRLYGNPIFLGMGWGHFLDMTIVGIALLIISLVQFRYADIKLG